MTKGGHICAHVETHLICPFCSGVYLYNVRPRESTSTEPRVAMSPESIPTGGGVNLTEAFAPLVVPLSLADTQAWVPNPTNSTADVDTSRHLCCQTNRIPLLESTNFEPLALLLYCFGAVTIVESWRGDGALQLDREDSIALMIASSSGSV